MAALGQVAIAAVVVLLAGTAPAAAQTSLTEGAIATVAGLGPNGAFPVLTQGQVVFVNAQRLVVTQEPPPAAQVSEPPPAPPVQSSERPAAPSAGSIWVDGHWTLGAAGFTWVSGRFIPPRAGHIFVPPRWAVLDDQFLFFNGFFVPFGVFVRSHFNKFFFSGTVPQRSQRVDRGPYWPIGLPSPRRPLTSANARDPYWPVGAPTRANSPFNRATTSSQFRPVGLRR
jgi:hypothetical protein